MTKRICLECGKEFFIRTHLLQHGCGHYCSMPCQRLGKRLKPGLRIGRLVLIEETGERDQFNCIEYEFICDCGIKTIASARHLAHKKSCGCLATESRANTGRRNALDVTGVRSGRLIAIRRSVERNSRGKILWECKCDCGNVILARADLIKNQILGSCGCAMGYSVRPDNVREMSRRQSIKYRKNNNYKLNDRIGNAIRGSLKNGKKNKRSWEAVVGYSLKELSRRLKRTIPAGYYWEDFLAGRLHIDHIVPLSVFNFNSVDDIDFGRAWALKNLQLLPAKENMSKKATITSPVQPSFSWS